MLLELKNITKTYGSVVANHEVSLSLSKGEVLAIVGENGAGKSTIMKILYGLEHADSGEIYLNGEKLAIHNPSDAMAAGIGMVQQHFMLFPSMTVTENIVYNNELRRGMFLDLKACRTQVQQLCQTYGLRVDPDAVVEDCPVGTQQRVEILKTLYQNADIIIFDEPSAVLTPLEVTDLLKTIRALADMGKSIILITHKLGEVMTATDRVVVMRDGHVVAELLTAETNVEELSYHMVGRKIETPPVEDVSHGAPLLVVEDLTLLDDNGRALLEHISLHVDRGEIVGIAGVSGNGQSELVRSLTGLESDCSGSVTLDGTQLLGKTVSQVREAGVSHIPEDRYAWGSAAQASLTENALMGFQRGAQLSKHGILNTKKTQEHAATLIDEYAVKAASVHQSIRELSGGNAQKLIVAREIAHETPLLVVSEPTRGVDIGAMEFIHNRLLEKRKSGDGILLVSSELSEIMKLSDRIYVLFEGRIAGEFERGAASEAELGLFMLGGGEG